MFHLPITGKSATACRMDQKLVDTLTAWRHHLHAHPELTLHETETAAFVCAKLQELGIPFVAGVGGHGEVLQPAHGRHEPPPQRRPPAAQPI